MKSVIFSAIYIVLIFLLSKFVFEPTYLYYELTWLDIPMHILGGFGVACLTWAILSYNKKQVSFARLIFFYVAVAVVWEVYEYFGEMSAGVEWNGWFDTIKDIIDGFIGMTVGYYFMKK
jgi:hypothetical protein